MPTTPRNKKISQLDAATVVNPSDALPVVQDGQTKQAAKSLVDSQNTFQSVNVTGNYPATPAIIQVTAPPAQTARAIIQAGDSGAPKAEGSITFGNGTHNHIDIDGGDNNYISLRSDQGVGVGKFTAPAPSAALHIEAGQTDAGTAPIKINAGPLLNTPEPGAIEFDGTHFYGTLANGTRKQLDN